MHDVRGKHYLIELNRCNPGRLERLQDVQATVLEAVRMSNATILDHTFHQFAPHGVSGCVLIAESHVAIHTWPEWGYAAVDIFTCGREMLPQKAIEHLKLKFSAEEVTTREIERPCA